jgi:cobalamin-dependent methionine synthase I
MTTTPARACTAPQFVGGRIIEAHVKVSVDATRPLPLVCALYAVESSDGVWLCAYYGANRSVFDFLPQKGADVEERKLGIAFRTKRFIPKNQYQPEQWEEFKKDNFMAYGGHGE